METPYFYVLYDDAVRPFRSSMLIDLQLHHIDIPPVAGNIGRKQGEDA